LSIKGKNFAEDGKLQEALADFQKAALIDPSLFIAQQELKRTLQMINEKENPPPQAAGPPGSLRRKISEAGGPVELAPISVVPITVKLTEDSKVIYQTIGQLAGINVLFDPDYTSRRIKVELNGVTLGRRAADYGAGIENFLASGDQQYDFCRPG